MDGWHQKKLASSLAGYRGSAGNPILADFILVAQKLEQLGFTYHKGKVVIRDDKMYPLARQKVKEKR